MNSPWGLYDYNKKNLTVDFEKIIDRCIVVVTQGQVCVPAPMAVKVRYKDKKKHN
jgi:hypothetical protein